jgi:hypothetical protein
MTVVETPTGSGITRGAHVPPKVDALHVAEIIAEIEKREFHSWPRLGEQVGLGEQARKHIVREGLIQPEPLVKRCEGYKVNQDEAWKLLLAAALAIAAGVAIAVMLRGIKESGLPASAAQAALRSMTT